MEIFVDLLERSCAEIIYKDLVRRSLAKIFGSNATIYIVQWAVKETADGLCRKLVQRCAEMPCILQGCCTNILYRVLWKSLRSWRKIFHRHLLERSSHRDLVQGPCKEILYRETLHRDTFAPIWIYNERYCAECQYTFHLHQDLQQRNNLNTGDKHNQTRCNLGSVLMFIEWFFHRDLTSSTETACGVRTAGFVAAHVRLAPLRKHELWHLWWLHLWKWRTRMRGAQIAGGGTAGDLWG